MIRWILNQYFFSNKKIQYHRSSLIGLDNGAGHGLLREPVAEMPGQLDGLSPIELALADAHALAILLQEGRHEFVADQRGKVGIADRCVFCVWQNV